MVHCLFNAAGRRKLLSLNDLTQLIIRALTHGSREHGAFALFSARLLGHNRMVRATGEKRWCTIGEREPCLPLAWATHPQPGEPHALNTTLSALESHVATC